MASRPADMGVFAPHITGKNRDGSDYVPPEGFAEWTVTNLAQGPAALSVSKGGESGKRHFVTGISGAFSAAKIGQIRLFAGAEQVFVGYLHNQRGVERAEREAEVFRRGQPGLRKDSRLGAANREKDDPAPNVHPAVRGIAGVGGRGHRGRG